METIAARNFGKIDWAYVEENLRPLAELKEAPEIMEELARLRRLRL
ncbi:MAG: hypothetical protein SFV18_10575 [Bryobacteraceae bacterium]|nr:hypothetical protein [Bryobacteraceae bacterium]